MNDVTPFEKTQRERAVRQAIQGIRKGQDVEILVRMAASIAYQEGVQDMTKEVIDSFPTGPEAA